jgi:hypothetical protein
LLKRVYDANELSVDLGDEIIGELVESGWVWCHNQKGERGWIPLECLEALNTAS